MSDKQMINRKPWLVLELASPGVRSRSKDSKSTPQLRRCLWRCHTNSLGKMKGTNAPCLVCREHDSCTFHHPQHDSHTESSQITEEFDVVWHWGFRFTLASTGGTSTICWDKKCPPPSPKDWDNDEGDFEWRLGRDHVLQSPERQVASEDTAHLLCWHEPQNYQFYLDYGACSIWILAMIKKN